MDNNIVFLCIWSFYQKVKGVFKQVIVKVIVGVSIQV